jgi:hypothetical protein
MKRIKGPLVLLEFENKMTANRFLVVAMKMMS